MSKIDFSWFNSEIGSNILQSVKQDEKLKRFGLLEKPTLAAPYSQYDEVNYKILIIGKSFCGKTSFMDSLCQSKTSKANTENDSTDYDETSGIHITHLFWPVKMYQIEKFIMFNLSMWDVGKLASTKYDYILPSSTENLDCFIFVFSWTDKQSFMEIYESIKKIYESPSEQNLPKLIIGTKFDQVIHSDIDQDMINQLEDMSHSKIIRFSSNDCSFQQIALIMNKLCDVLWDRDQKLAALN